MASGRCPRRRAAEAAARRAASFKGEPKGDPFAEWSEIADEEARGHARLGEIFRERGRWGPAAAGVRKGLRHGGGRSPILAGRYAHAPLMTGHKAEGPRRCWPGAAGLEPGRGGRCTCSWGGCARLRQDWAGARDQPPPRQPQDPFDPEIHAGLAAPLEALGDGRPPRARSASRPILIGEDASVTGARSEDTWPSARPQRPRPTGRPTSHAVEELAEARRVLLGRDREAHRRPEGGRRAPARRALRARPLPVRRACPAWPRRCSSRPWPRCSTCPSTASSSRPTSCPPTSPAPTCWRRTTPPAGAPSASCRGPIFANIVLADEINRTPPKTQAALLQAMQEYRVTAGGADLPARPAVPGLRHAEPHRAGGHLSAARGAARPLHVPGRRRLPAARRGGGDRPLHHQRARGRRSSRVLSPERIRAAAGAGAARARPPTTSCATRSSWCAAPAPERAGRARLREGERRLGRRPARLPVPDPGRQGRAILDGRMAASDEDVRALARPVLVHRVITNFHAESDGVSSRRTIVDRLLETVQAREPSCRCRPARCSTRWCCAGSASLRAARARHRRGRPLRAAPKSPHHGQSVEFAEHKEYAPGDEIRHIDWKAYGKFDKYYVKRFEQETKLRAYLVVDSSGSMGYRGAAERSSKLELREHAGGLARLPAGPAAGRGRAGGLSPATVRTALPPRATAGAAARHRGALEALPARRGRPELGAAVRLRRRARAAPLRGAGLLRPPRPGRAEVLKRLVASCGRRKHEVTLFHVLDPAEIEFPFEDPTLFLSMEDARQRGGPRARHAQGLPGGPGGWLEDVGAPDLRGVRRRLRLVPHRPAARRGARPLPGAAGADAPREPGASSTRRSSGGCSRRPSRSPSTSSSGGGRGRRPSRPSTSCCRRAARPSAACGSRGSCSSRPARSCSRPSALAIARPRARARPRPGGAGSGGPRRPRPSSSTPPPPCATGWAGETLFERAPADAREALAAARRRRSRPPWWCAGRSRPPAEPPTFDRAAVRRVLAEAAQTSAGHSDLTTCVQVAALRALGDSRRGRGCPQAASWWRPT